MIELITGESRSYEVVHVRKAIAAGLPYVGLCWDETIQQRARRYMEAGGIGESQGVQLVTRHEIEMA